MLDSRQAISAFAALAHDTRLAIYRLLVRVGPQGLAASRIGDELGIAPSSLSFHLKELTHAGLIKPRQDGRFLIYAAEFATINALMAFMSENCCGGNSCLPVPHCEATGEGASSHPLNQQ